METETKSKELLNEILKSLSPSAKDEPTGDLSTPEVVGDLLWVRPLGFMHVGLKI